MIGLTHSAAHDLLNAGSTEIDPAERVALAAHLDQCPECRAYAANFAELHTMLSSLLHARWPTPTTPLTHDALLLRLEQRQARRRTLHRVNTLAFAASMIILVLAVMWLLNRSVAPTTAPQSASAPTVPDRIVPPPVSAGTPSPAPAPRNPIRLIGYEGPQDLLWPGSSLTLTLHWQTSAPIQADYRAFVHVLDGQGNLVASSDQVPGGRATTTWLIGEPITDVHALGLPDSLTPGSYAIVAGLVDVQNGARMTFGDQDSVRVMTITVPALQHPIHQGFGDFATLLGADGLPDSIRPGDTLTPTLYWRALAPTSTAYLISLQVFDDSKGLVAQSDGEPGQGSRPTTSWLPGEVIVDARPLTLPADLKPGQYRLLVLMFDATTGAQVFTQDGNGAVTLPTLVVKANAAATPDQPLQITPTKTQP